MLRLTLHIRVHMRSRRLLVRQRRGGRGLRGGSLGPHHGGGAGPALPVAAKVGRLDLLARRRRVVVWKVKRVIVVFGKSCDECRWKVRCSIFFGLE